MNPDRNRNEVDDALALGVEALHERLRRLEEALAREKLARLEAELAALPPAPVERPRFRRAAGAPFGRLTPLKRVLLSLVILGAVSSVIGTGTFATFTAQTTNSSNTFSTGTLVLSNTKGATVCLSTGGGSTDTNSNGTGCADLIAASVKKPGDTASGTVTLRSVGSVGATSFKLWSTACTASDAASETYHGTGNPCSVIDITVHDDTNNRCYYPTNAPGACTLTTGKTLADFVASTGSEASALSLSTTGLSTGIAFTIVTQMESTAGNNMQGRAASIDFNWKIYQ